MAGIFSANGLADSVAVRFLARSFFNRRDSFRNLVVEFQRSDVLVEVRRFGDPATEGGAVSHTEAQAKITSTLCRRADCLRCECVSAGDPSPKNKH